MFRLVKASRAKAEAQTARSERGKVTVFSGKCVTEMNEESK